VNSSCSTMMQGLTRRPDWLLIVYRCIVTAQVELKREREHRVRPWRTAATSRAAAVVCMCTRSKQSGGAVSGHTMTAAATMASRPLLSSHILESRRAAKRGRTANQFAQSIKAVLSQIP